VSAPPCFTEQLVARASGARSWLCIGLDPDPAHIPPAYGEGIDAARAFLRDIIDATAHAACAFKPNSAFFEQYGWQGFRFLGEVRDMIPAGIPMILDAKRGDIGHTAEAYARACFDELRADAVTLNPLLGVDSLEPFLRYRDRGAFILCRTSNKGAADFQLPGNFPERVARAVPRWSALNANVGLVVGATDATDLARVRELCPETMFLVPGVGAQGGDLEAVVRAGAARSSLGLIINASRAILHASATDPAGAAHREAVRLRDAITEASHAAR
jgi:orotidine-5'-phosphate decarboxylase